MIRFHILLFLSTHLVAAFFIDSLCDCLIHRWRSANVKGGSSISTISVSEIAANLIIIASHVRLVQIGF